MKKYGGFGGAVQIVELIALSAKFCVLVLSVEES